MKYFRVMAALTITATLTFFLAPASTVSAGKPAEVVEWSNGFPSGPHFNMNIHGKNQDFLCDSEPGGGSVFVPEYGTSEIQLIQNKKSTITELTVLDKCAFDDETVKVQLPYGHYQVYARILAKPKKAGEYRAVSFSPKLIEACNDITDYDPTNDGVVNVDDLLWVDINGDGVVNQDDNYDLNNDGVVDQLDVDIWTSTFGGMTDCTDSSLIGLGIVTGNGAFTKDNQSLERTKGKSKAVDITNMLMYSGLIFDTSLDITGDVDLTLADLTDDQDLDGDIDLVDFDLWIDKLELENLVIDARTEPIWIFDIADLVVYGWDYQNNGAKLVQIRFYIDDETAYVIE